MENKDTASAEKAFSEAVESAQSSAKQAAPVEAQDTAAPVETAPAKATPAAKKPVAAKKPASPKIDKAVSAAAKKPKRRAPTKKATVKKPVKAKTPAATPAPKKVEITMASKTKKFDVVASLNEAKAKSEAVYRGAYKKGSEFYAESKELTKANADALVASSKVVVEGLKTAGNSSVTESREVVNTIADDMKSFAAVNSPAELFELQGKLAARNYDASLAYATKSANSLKEFALKAFAPISAQAKANYQAVQKLAD